MNPILKIILILVGIAVGIFIAFTLFFLVLGALDPDHKEGEPYCFTKQSKKIREIKRREAKRNEEKVKRVVAEAAEKKKKYDEWYNSLPIEEKVRIDTQHMATNLAMQADIDKNPDEWVRAHLLMWEAYHPDYTPEEYDEEEKSLWNDVRERQADLAAEEAEEEREREEREAAEFEEYLSHGNLSKYEYDRLLASDQYEIQSRFENKYDDTHWKMGKLKDELEKKTIAP